MTTVHAFWSGYLLGALSMLLVIGPLTLKLELEDRRNRRG